ncbi:uncharacterized protein BKCO1_400042 [Diplodia corticola]|uniref:Uncharacterized protein n=1 Tax=Diplodia corticola TaxID=236234 RepID=A0A1J9RAK5_9PEZI|nr:uncharacterized protein BKCO1_400042 [Diplodia corticola]OJD38630.1 hypothetical protein BKCO1_400042 [Diplodia corticola]
MVSHHELTAASNDSPVLSQQNCAAQGPDKSSGICTNKCMRQYMTAMTLSPVTWVGDNSVFSSATLFWTRPRWGDADGKHVPLSDQVSEYSKTKFLPSSESAALSKSLALLHKSPKVSTSSTVPQKTTTTTTETTTETTTTATTAALPAIFPRSASTPTLSVASTACLPDPMKHPAVTSRDPRDPYREETWVKPTNPACDRFDPMGYNANELLWMYQDKKNHVECWDYESCWDHCKKVKTREHNLRNIMLGILGAICGIVLAAVAYKLWQKKKKAKADKDTQARKKWGHELSPAAAQNVDGPMDTVAASASDEESARRAASSFRMAFNGGVMNRRDANASGSESVPAQDDRTAMRRAY